LHKPRFFLHLHSENNGRVAEWLGRGLQNLVQRFESARDLSEKHLRKWVLFSLTAFLPLGTFLFCSGNYTMSF